MSGFQIDSGCQPIRWSGHHIASYPFDSFRTAFFSNASTGGMMTPVAPISIVICVVPSSLGSPGGAEARAEVHLVERAPRREPNRTRQRRGEVVGRVDVELQPGPLEDARPDACVPGERRVRGEARRPEGAAGQ